MALAKFNWRAEGGSSTAPQHFSFVFGETWKLMDHTLSKGENAKGCTLDGACVRACVCLIGLDLL